MAIKKDITDRRPPTDRGGLCWRTFSRNQRGVLRVELRSGKIFLLPYMNWNHAHLEKVADREELIIKFHSHEVRIEGQNLRPLLSELQATNVEMLREVPDEFAVKGKAGAMIHEIQVQEAQSPGDREQ